MKKIVVMLLVLSLLGSCVLALAEPAVLTVRGVGVVNLNADAASITMGVREIAEDVTSAQATVNRKIASVIEKMKEMGIEAKDIHTNYISIYPEYDYNDAKNPVVGYTAETSISVTTSDTENVGKYIDAAFEAGANTFSDISFSASDTTEESNQALKLAIERAFDKASAMAEAAGMKLGELVSISEAEYSYADNGAYYAKEEVVTDAGAGTEVYASTLQVSATVSVQFAMQAVD